MVTTNSETEQIRKLLAEAEERMAQLAAAIDEKDENLVGQMYEIVRMAIRAVTPVLKYVDQEIAGLDKDTIRRGISLGGGFNLLRGGRLKQHNSVSGRDVDISSRFIAGDYEMLLLINMLKALRDKLSEVLNEIDERRANLAKLSAQIAQAAQAFEV